MQIDAEPAYHQNLQIGAQQDKRIGYADRNRDQSHPGSYEARTLTQSLRHEGIR